MRCGLAAGLAETLFYILPHAMEESQAAILTLTENIQRQQLTDPEVYLGVKEIMRLHPAWQRKDLAEKLSLSPPMVTNILSVDGLIPAAREAFLAGAFGFSTAYEISQGDDAQQHQMLSLKLGGASRGALRQARRKANGSDPVKVKRIKIETSLGITVTFSGNDLALDDAIEAAPEAAKIMEKGRKDGLTAKTIQQMSAEKAKGG